MNDLEHDLRYLLETKSREGEVGSALAPTVLKRAHRRQVGTVLTAIAATVVLVVGSIAGIQALTSTRPEPHPGGLPGGEVGEGTFVLPFATMTPPTGWTIQVSGAGDQVLQLTNFDPEFGTPCFEGGSPALPPLGAILLVERFPGAAGSSDPTWPVALSGDGERAHTCTAAQEETFGPADQLAATWRVGSTRIVATVAFGGETPNDARRMMLAAFDSLQVLGGDEPQLEPFGGTPSIALDSMESPIGPVTLYAYRDDFEGGTTWIGLAGTAGSGLGGAGSIGDEIPAGDESVTMNLDSWGGVVWGDVADTAVRAELWTVEGLTFPAHLISLPSSLEADGHLAVWGVVEGETGDRVTTVLYDAEGNPINETFPTAPRELVASGTDPTGTAWEVYLTHEQLGDGISFQTEGGGGGSCCVRPLKADQHLTLDSWSTTGHQPKDVLGFASLDVTLVAYVHEDGTTIEGELFAFPEEVAGPMQLWVLFVPGDLPVNGDVVAYDAAGNEVGREFVGDVGEPAGPAPDIDSVWALLRSARDAISMWGGEQGSLEALTLDAANAFAPEIAWNASGQGKPVPNQVSIRGVAPAGGDELTGWSGWTVVLVSITPDLTHTYCLAVNIDEGGGGNFRYGTQDTASYQECRGGWE
jgi:hypothetical protein